MAEIVNAQKERWEISLKGSGLTPYSRMADGRAVLRYIILHLLCCSHALHARSSIREYLASEAMAALKIPTTRALSLISSTEKV